MRTAKQIKWGLAVLFMTTVAAPTWAQRPVLSLPNDKEITTQCQKSIVTLKQQVKELEQIAVETEEGSRAFLTGWNRLQVGLENVQRPMSLFAQVSPDKLIRKNADACALEVDKFETALYQNAKLYRNMRVVRVNNDAERKLRQDTISTYEDAGVALLPDKRERVKEILIRLTEIEQQFAKNIRENKTKITFTPYELQGMPKYYFDMIKKDDNGNYQLGFSYPEYIPFMRYAENDKAREKYRFAFINRGTPANLNLLQESVNLRHELAILLGYRSYADYVLRRRMAKKPITVAKFLNDIEKIVTQAEKREMDELKAFKATVRNLPIEQATIKRWDINYWTEKVKQIKYNIDQNVLRQYFPTQASMEWVMGVASKLYNIRFRKADVPTWHKDVQYYDVLDGAMGGQLGGIYLDIYPRANKYGHAAAFSVRRSSTLENRLPVSALVANFNKRGLDIGELETLLHEFGHVLHGVLSKTRFVDQAGTSVERDFVEAPSQMFEEWAHSYEALSLLPSYCNGSCPRIDKDMLKRMNASRHFGLGSNYSRQLLYSKYDMTLYGDQSLDVMKTWKKMEGDTLLGYDPGTEFPGQFSHIVSSGYAAGYYSYLWSKVIALDMLTRFNGNLMDEKVGELYRRSILEHGGEQPAERLVHYFLGRTPDSAAFYEKLSNIEGQVQ